MIKWNIDKQSTKSSTYILPIVDSEVQFGFLDKIVSSYLFNNDKELKFCVLYKFSGSRDFMSFEERMMKHTLYDGHEDYGEYVLYKFKLAPDMRVAVDLFSNGKYSQFSKKYKDAIESFVKRRGFTNSGRIRMILDRSEVIREELEGKLGVKIDLGNELSSPPDLSSEVFSNYVTKVEINGDKTDFNED